MPTKQPMTITTTHDVEGVILQINYTPPSAADPVPTLHSVFMLGADYKPCGPDLTAFLDGMLAPTATDHNGETTEVSPFLSLVTEEILNGTNKQRAS